MDSPERKDPPVQKGKPEKKRRDRLQRCKRLMPAAYEVVLDKKRAFQGRFVVLCVGPPVKRPHAQIGIITSRKALKTAVERNRARRLMREAFRTQQQKVKPGTRIILIGRRNLAAEGNLADVAYDFKMLCFRAGVWKKPEQPKSALPPPPPPRKMKKKPKPKFGRFKAPEFPPEMRASNFGFPF